MADFDPVELVRTEQRDYGVLTGGCRIHLSRFAVVYGSVDSSPDDPGSATVIYGRPTEDFNYGELDVMFKQCGYTYQGNFSVIFAKRSTDKRVYSAFAIAEARYCKNSNKVIVVESYGESAAPASVSLWFLRRTEKTFASWADFPNPGGENYVYIDGSTGIKYIWDETNYIPGTGWEKLGSATTGNTIPYVKTSYNFVERNNAKNGLVEIDCCKRCDECVCYNCDTRFRNYTTVTYPVISDTRGNHPTISISTAGMLGNSATLNKLLNIYGDTSLNMINELIVEYTVNDHDIDIWGYTLGKLNDYVAILFNKKGNLYIHNDGYVLWNKGVNGDWTITNSGYRGPRANDVWPAFIHHPGMAFVISGQNWYFDGNFVELFYGEADGPPGLYQNYQRGYLCTVTGNLWVGSAYGRWHYYYTIPINDYDGSYEGQEENVCIRTKFKVISDTFQTASGKSHLYGTSSNISRNTRTSVEVASDMLDTFTLSMGSVVISYTLDASSKVVSSYTVKSNRIANEYVEVWEFNPVSGIWILAYEGWTNDLEEL